MPQSHIFGGGGKVLPCSNDRHPFLTGGNHKNVNNTQRKCMKRVSFEYNKSMKMGEDSMNIGKSRQLDKHGFGSLNRYVTIIRTSCFDTDFLSQIKLLNFP